MIQYKINRDNNGKKTLTTNVTGKALLSIPQLNKGTAFTNEERLSLGLIGKLPLHVETLDEQVSRTYRQCMAYDKKINRNIYLNNVLNFNQTLFYRLVREHLTELMPTIYTPIVGAAVRTFNRNFTQPRGLYISYPDRKHLKQMLQNRTHPHVDIIVATDGEGVLGIGDQGIGSMDIAIAKLAVYSIIGGVNPLRTLPIVLDVGTNNEDLLNDPMYLGWRHKRLDGQAYDDFIDQFVTEVKAAYPDVFLHWEDFGRSNANRILSNYRDKICSFNDDIQGTGIVALAALLSAVKKTSLPLKEHRIIMYGAGTAGMGVSGSIFRFLCKQGLSETEARKMFWLIDQPGLLTDSLDNITEAQAPFLRSSEEVNDWQRNNLDQIDLMEVVKNIQPTILIGCSAMTNAFSEAVIVEMKKHCETPIIFPLSNPTERSEATPEDLLNWTDGKALIATGSPFEAVYYDGEKHSISQSNNYFAFPGIGLGVLAVKASCITDYMLAEASRALSEFPKSDDSLLLPTLDQAPESSLAIAKAVAEAAIKEGLNKIDVTENTVDQLIADTYWEPEYLPYILAPKST